jgi:hypothetical protein
MEDHVAKALPEPEKGCAEAEEHLWVKSCKEHGQVCSVNSTLNGGKPIGMPNDCLKKYKDS